MPCFVRQIRKLGVKMPSKVSLFEDAEEIERKLKLKLLIDTHQELHQKLNSMPEKEVKEILEKVLAEVNAKKEKDSYPDPMKKLREKAKEIFVAC